MSPWAVSFNFYMIRAIEAGFPWDDSAAMLCEMIRLSLSLPESPRIQKPYHLTIYILSTILTYFSMLGDRSG